MGRKGIILINIQNLLEEIAIKKNNNEGNRKYLGFSEIGHECERYLWIKYHHPYLCEQITGSLLRIFDQGRETEKKLMRELTETNISVNGSQKEFKLLHGYFMGHCDGIITIDSNEYILEIKSSSHENWRLFKKNGVSNHAFLGSKYIAQCILYAGCADLPGSIILIENKNNQQLYQEYIPFDQDIFNGYIAKAKRIIYGDIPIGISNRKDWFKCIHCQFNHDEACRKIWHGEAPF